MSGRIPDHSGSFGGGLFLLPERRLGPGPPWRASPCEMRQSEGVEVRSRKFSEVFAGGAGKLPGSFGVIHSPVIHSLDLAYTGG